MNEVCGILEHLLFCFFITGLKSEIHRELSICRPSSLTKAFALTRDYEARLEEAEFDSRPCSHWPLKVVSITSVSPSQTLRISLHKPPTSTPVLPSSILPLLLPTPQLPVKRMSPTDIKEKCDKGLCYNCDKKWSPSYRCRNKFLLLLGTEDGDESDLPNPTALEFGDDTTVGDISSLHALSGSTTPRSLQLIGSIHDHQVRLLVDSGSTHNCLQSSIAQSLKLPIQDIPSFRVFVGNGDFL